LTGSRGSTAHDIGLIVGKLEGGWSAKLKGKLVVVMKGGGKNGAGLAPIEALGGAKNSSKNRTGAANIFILKNGRSNVSVGGEEWEAAPAADVLTARFGKEK
jgi:hypothetical protein